LKKCKKKIKDLGSVEPKSYRRSDDRYSVADGVDVFEAFLDAREHINCGWHQPCKGIRNFPVCVYFWLLVI